jgi:hypothetical protein
LILLEKLAESRMQQHQTGENMAHWSSEQQRSAVGANEPTEQPQDSSSPARGDSPPLLSPTARVAEILKRFYL